MKKKMQNAECKMQNDEKGSFPFVSLVCFAFENLFSFFVPIESFS